MKTALYSGLAAALLFACTAAFAQGVASPTPTAFAPLPGAFPTSTPYKIGDSVMTTVRLNVRSAASLKGIVRGRQLAGSVGTIIDGPVSANGYRWWKLDYATGTDGWSAGAYLTRASSTTNVKPGAIRLLSPNGGESWVQGSSHAISWTAPTTTSNVDITMEYYNSCAEGSGPVKCMLMMPQPYSIAKGIANTGSFQSDFVTDVGGTLIYHGQYEIVITDSSDQSISGRSASPFSITSLDAATTSTTTAAEVTSPVHSESWLQGTTQTISWKGFSGPVSIYLQPWAACLDSSPRCMIAVVAPIQIASGISGSNYQWMVSTVRNLSNAQPAGTQSMNLLATPLDLGGLYRIMITDAANNSTSSATFTIYSNVCGLQSACNFPMMTSPTSSSTAR